MQTLRLISPAIKLRLLEGILYAPTRKIGVREIAKRLKVNPGYVSVVLRKMAKQGLIRDGSLCNSDPRVMSLRLIFNMDRLVAAWSKLKQQNVRGFGVFGSWAKGSNTENSDLDVWVKVDVEPDAETTGRFRNILKRESGVSEVGLIVLSPDRIKELKKSDSIFYSTLLNSFIIGGGSIE